MRRLILSSPEAMFELGRSLGRAAGPGTVIAVHGELGTGKTVLARGVGAGLAVPTRVQSPTYVIMQSHPGGRLPLWHVDLYRLSDPDDLEQLGLDEALASGGVMVVEWPDRFDGWLPADHLAIHLEHRGSERAATIEGRGAAHAELERQVG
ncbi:MAG: tRNA threonylcarbamoyladenosine biosynthesis protein TsaE [Myxococcota bacterium]|jgi:tRNA threonylcarbamoyladenosine biosynthesis protein TsaE